MELKELIDDVKSRFEELKNDAKASIEDQKKALDELREKMNTIMSEGGVAKASDIDAIQKQFDELAAKVNEKSFGGKQDKSFGGALAGAITEIKDELSSFVNRKGLSKTVELKDMDFDNFSSDALDALTSTTLPGVYQYPWQQLWLRNIFPNASTSSKTVKYVQEDATANEGNGSADIWDGDAPIAELLAKPDVDFSFTDASADVYWIAGVTRLKREMLDDIPFLRTYIPQQLIYGKRGILIRENALILSTLNSNSVAYNGGYSVLIEQIVDAVSQLADNYHQATHILMNNRDVNDIILNKAANSGEYDLPPSVVQVLPNGQVSILGRTVIGLPQFAPGTAFVLDANQSLFLSRLSPEVRFSEEDRDNFVKNLVTIRAEERAAFLVYDPTSVVKLVQTT